MSSLSNADGYAFGLLTILFLTSSSVFSQVPTFSSSKATTTTNIEIVFTSPPGNLLTVGAPENFTVAGATVTAAAIRGGAGNSKIVDLTINAVGTDFTSADLDIAAGAVTNADGSNLAINNVAVTDGIAPIVNSIVRQNPTAAITNADNVTFRVTFSEAVAGVSADGSDFSLSGAATGTITNAALATGNSYDVDVSTVAGNGNLNLNFSGGQDITDNSPATNPFGGTISSEEEYTIDNNNPAAPSVPDLSASDDSGSSNSDNLTNVTTNLTFTGTSEPNATIQLYDAATPVGTTATADGSGNWTKDINLAAGTYSINARQTDVAGNQGPASAGLSVTIDTGAPTVSTVTSNATVAGVLGIGGSITFTADILVTEPGLILAPTTYNTGTLSWSTGNGGDTYTATYTVLGGHPDQAVPLQLTGVTATDAAGNTSAPANGSDVAKTIDANAPAAPTALDLAAADDTGSSNTDNLTNQTSALTISGSAEANSTVNVYRAGATLIGTAAADGAGAWSVDVSLAAGAHTVTARATDAAGNQGPASTGLDITVDTTLPVAPSTPDLAGADDSGSSNSDNITNVTTNLTFSGTTEANAVIQLYDGATPVGSPTTANGAGAWTLDINLPAGSYLINARATDVAGNLGPASGNLSLTIDTTAPFAPSVPDLDPVDDSGSSNSDNITNVTTGLTFNGTSEANAVIQLYNGATPQGTTTTASGGGGWTKDLNLVAGSYNINARATDLAGNLGPASGNLALTVDTSAPTITSLLRQNPMTATTTGTSVTFRVTFAEAVNNVDLTDFELNPSNTATGTLSGIATVTPNLVFDVTVNPVSGNFHILNLDLAVTQNIVDQAGNALSNLVPTTEEEYTVDNIAPSLSPDQMVLSLNGGSPETITFTLNEELSAAAGAVAGFTTSNGAIASAIYSGKGTTNTITLTSAADGQWTTAATTVSYTPGTLADLRAIPMAAIVAHPIIELVINLGPGDIAFSSVRADSYSGPPATEDHFSVVLLRNVPIGTQITFTDRGWNSTTSSIEDFSGDGVFTWTATSALNAGFEIKFNSDSNDDWTASSGTVANDAEKVAISASSGDNLMAYQGSASTPTFLTAIKFADTNNWEADGDPENNQESAIPSGLTAANSLLLGDFDNGAYLISNGTVSSAAGIRSRLTTVANWDRDNNPANVDIPGSTAGNWAAFPSGQNYTIIPVITAVTVPAVTMLVGSSVTATITTDDDSGLIPMVLTSGSIGGFTLGSLNRTNGTTYTAQFTVTEGGTDVAAGSNIPVANLVLTNSLGNPSATYSTPISQGGDPIDANSPRVLSINRQSVTNAWSSTGGTSASSVVFRVTFSENINSGTLSAADFTLTTGGSIAGATIGAPMTVTGTSVFDITVSGYTGTGTVRLNYVDTEGGGAGGSVADLLGNLTITSAGVPDGSFNGQTYTIVLPEPTENVDNTTITNSTTTSSIQITWVEPVPAPTHYLIVARRNIAGTFPSPFDVIDGNEDGVQLADDVDLSDGTGSKVIAAGTSTYTFTNLESGTDYDFQIYVYNWASNTTTDNTDYRTTPDVTPPTGIPSFTIGTPSAAVSTLTGGTGVASISSLDDSNTEYRAVFTFEVNDDNNDPDDATYDNTAFKFNNLVIRAGTGNQIVWPDAIADGNVRLSDDEGHSQTANITVAGTTTSNSTITIASIASDLTTDLGFVDDDETKVYTLEIYLRSSMLNSLGFNIDNLQFVFQVDSTSFTYDDTPGRSSQLLAAPAQSVNSGIGNNFVTVVAQHLNFTTQPQAQIGVGTDLSASSTPLPVVTAQDDNGNRDKDYTNSITIDNTAGLPQLPSPFVANPVAGIYTIPNLRYNNSGTTKIRVTGSGFPAVSVGQSNDVVVVYSSLTRIALGVASPGSFSSLTTALSGAVLPQVNAVQNFEVNVTDDFGANAVTFDNNDAVATTFTQIVISRDGANDGIGDWTLAVAGAELRDQFGNAHISPAISANALTFNVSATALGTITDGTTKSYRLKIWLKNPVDPAIADLIDNLDFVFQTTEAQFTTAAGSSTLQASSANSGNNNNRVIVTASQLDFVTQPAAFQNYDANVTPSPVVKARDANGNLDLNYTTGATVATSNPVVFTTANTTLTTTNGVITFDPSFRITSTGGGASGAITNLTVSSGALTPGTSNNFSVNYSGNSDIIKEPGFTYAGNDNLVYINYQATDIVNSGTSIVLEQFTVRDSGPGPNDADGSPTVLTGIVLEVTNYQNLRKLALFNGATEVKELDVAASIVPTGPTTGNLDFNSFVSAFQAADGLTSTLSIRASFKGSGVTDNQVMTFRVVSVTAGAVSSSQFANTTPAGIQSNPTGNQNRIEVTADRFTYTSIPVSATINVPFAPVVIEAHDVHLNRDLDFTSAVTAFSNTDGLSMLNTPFTPDPILSFNTPSAGVLTLPANFQFTSTPAAPPTELSISAGGINNQISPSFGVVASQSSMLTYETGAFRTRIPYISYQANPIPDTTSSFRLAKFRLWDGDGTPDADGAATTISSIQFAITTTDTLGNVVSGSNDIRQIALYNSAGLELGEQTLGAATTVTFNIAPANYITAADNGSTTFTLRATFENTAADIKDLDNIRVQVINVTQSDGSEFNPVTSVTNGSWTKATGAVTLADQTPSTKNKINVVATRLDFTTQPDAFSGVSEPFSAFTPVPVIEARDINQIVDIEHDYIGNLTVPGAAMSPNALNFSDGILTLQTVQYTQPGDGTITVASNGLSSAAGGSVACTHVDVINVFTTNTLGGVNQGTNLAGGSVNKVVFGFTVNTPYKITSPSNHPLLNEFTITFSNPITSVFTNMRVYETQLTSFTGAAVLVTSPTIGATLTPGAQSLRVDFSSGTPRDLSDPANATLSYFLVVDIDPTANGSTPKVRPMIEDLGYTDAATNNNLVISNGSTYSGPNVGDLTLGKEFSFAAIFPPTLVSSNPATGQLNVDPNKSTIDLVFSVPIWTLDGVIKLHDQTTPSNPPVTLNALNGFYAPPPPLPSAGTTTMPLQFAIPAGTLVPDNVYYVTIEPGNFDVNNPASNAGIMDQAQNLFPGISYSGTLYFKTANPTPPLMLTTSTPGVTNPSITNVTVGGATINATFTQKGKAYFAVLQAGSPAPTNAQIAGSPDPVGFVTRGTFNLVQESPISQFGIISASLATSTTYDVWVYAENDALPVPFPTPAPYGSLANNHVAGSTGPTLTFTTPASSGTTVTVSNPSINICSESYQPLNKPIIISEGNLSNFNSGPGVVSFNLILPAGFAFDVSRSGVNPTYGKLTLIGSDFPAGQPSPSLSFIGSSILQVSYINNGSASRDQIILSEFRIFASSATSGSILRLGGNALTSGVPDLSSVGTLSSSDAPGITFTNSYSATTFPLQPVVTYIPDNFNEPALTAELIPLPPAGDYGPTSFSGQGVNINILNLPAVTVDQPFQISVFHTDNNGCSSESFEQYTVYDHLTAIRVDGTPAPYCSVNTNFVVNQNTRPSYGLPAQQHSIAFNNVSAYYMYDLQADTLPGSTSIISGAAWQNVIKNNLLVQSAPVPDPPDNPDPLKSYYNYTFDEAVILDANFLSGGAIPDPYSNFRSALTSQNNYYYTGGSLGIVVLTGTFQSIANAALQIPLKQNIEFFLPAVPIVEVGLANRSFLDASDPLNPVGSGGPSNKGTPVFCAAGGKIQIEGWPKAAVGASAGTFELRDAASNNLLSPAAGFTDNGNGTAEIDPAVFNNNGFADIRIVYTYQENNSPCSSSGSQVIRITPNPTPNYTTSMLCEDIDVQFTDQSSIPAGFSITAWSWDFSDPNSGPLNSSSLQNPVHRYSQPGTFANVQLSVTSNWGCASTAPASQDLVVGGTPSVAFDFRGVAAGSNMTFQSNSTVFANSTIANLNWLFGDASSYASTNNAEFVNHTYAAPGPYNVDLIVASAIGCSDTLRRLVVMLPKVTPTDALPYEQDFETTNGNWQVLPDPAFAPSVPSWAWGSPAKPVINSTINGTKAWVTGLTGSYAPRERSYLYGPCFDMTLLARPMISFNSFNQMEDADGVVLQFSEDNKNIADPTKTWTAIGTFINGQSSGVEWYNAQGLASKPGNQVTGDYGWTSNRDSLWLVSRHILDAVLNKPQVVFRWALGSVKDLPARDGFSIDNVRIGNRTRTILLESFFNVANPAASEASEANFIRNFGTAAGTQVVKMNYHTSFKGDDPFYTDNPADPSSRALYYGITSTPLSRLDGERPAGPEAPASTWVQQQYNQQTLQLAEARIAINASVDSPTGSITINVDVTPGVDLPPETRLFVAIVEDSVLSSSLGPRTSQIQSGETYFISVVKKILPTASGLRLNTTLPASATPTTFGPFVYTPAASQLYSVPDDLYVVAFLQNENTKDVYQSEFTALLSDPSVVTGIEPEFYQNIAFFPNPADHELTVQLPEPAKAAVPLRMFDPMGRQVVDIRFEAGEQTRVIQTSDMASGLYIIQVEPGGVAVRKKQMIKH